MSILSGVGKTAKQMATGVSRIISPKKEPKPAQPKNFIQETPEEYAQRLMQRRSMRH